MRWLLLSAILLVGSVAAQESPHKPKTTDTESLQSIETLVEQLVELRSRRAILEKQEKELADSLRAAITRQQQRLAQLGFLLEQAPTPPVLPPVVKPSPIPVPVPPTDELTTAFHVDRDARRGTVDDLQALARIYRNAGEALDRSRPPTVAHLILGLDVISGRLKNNLPTVLTVAKQRLALELPPSSTVLTPPGPARDITPEALACKNVLIGLATNLERIAP